MTTPKTHAARERHWICGTRVRERRRELGLTQHDLVSRLHSRGNRTSNRALSAIEHGGGLELGLLPELAESLGCTVTYLLGLTDDPQEWQP
jgi:transcriptional regulator with XRE-family HTH domain